jgi:hypothetical protein
MPILASTLSNKYSKKALADTGYVSLSLYEG